MSCASSLSLSGSSSRVVCRDLPVSSRLGVVTLGHQLGVGKGRGRVRDDKGRGKGRKKKMRVVVKWASLLPLP